MMHKADKLVWALALIAGMAGSGCSDDGGGDDDVSGDAARGGTTAGAEARAGTGAVAGTTAGASGASTGSAGKAGGTAAAAGQGGAAGKSGSGGSSSAFKEVGVCGQRGMGTVDADSFEGYEELYIIGEEGFGDDICVVRFDVKRVGAAPDGCDDPAADVDCLWTHEVQYSNPKIMTDENGVCAKSELGLDADAIAEIDGSRAAYGFVSEYVGHNSVLLQYDEAMKKWIANGNATWDDATGAFRFDRRDGNCNY